MEEVSPEMQIMQDDLIEDNKFPIRVGKKIYMCRQLKSWAARRVSRIMAKENMNNPSGLIETLSALDKNGSLPARITSVLILNSWWKVKLFHWIHWRYLDKTHSYSDFVDAQAKIYKAMQLEAFQESMAYAGNVTILRKKMTQKEMQEQLFRAQQLAKEKGL